MTYKGKPSIYWVEDASPVRIMQPVKLMTGSNLQNSILLSSDMFKGSLCIFFITLNLAFLCNMFYILEPVFERQKGIWFVQEGKMIIQTNKKKLQSMGKQDLYCVLSVYVVGENCRSTGGGGFAQHWENAITCNQRVSHYCLAFSITTKISFEIRTWFLVIAAVIYGNDEWI